MFANSVEKNVTGSELAVDMLMENKDKIKLFDVYLSVAGSSMVLSKLVNIIRAHLKFETDRIGLRYIFRST